MARRWYVVHTYSGYENKVKTNIEHLIETQGLENNIFEILIPTEEVTELKEGGRRVTTERKVFPGYVLIKMNLDARTQVAVRNTPGVTGGARLRWSGRPPGENVQNKNSAGRPGTAGLKGLWTEG